LTRMAKRVNEERVVPPRPGGKGWAPTAIREILHREDYRGLVHWNRTQKVHGGGTRAQRGGTPDDSVTRVAPELRIVADELWDAAHRQMAQRRQAFTRRPEPGIAGAGAPRLDQPSPYLLSGLGRCVCGGAVIAMSRHHGRRRGFFYGCAYNWKRGPEVCRNNLHLPQAVLEGAVLEAVAAPLDARVVGAAVHEALQRLHARERQRTERRRGLDREMQLTRQREQRLAEAIAQGSVSDTPPDALLAALTAEQERRVALERELAMVNHSTTGMATDLAQLEHRLQQRAADVRAVLHRHLPQSRDVLRALLVDRLLFTPIAHAGTRGYGFVGHASYGGLLAGTAWPTTDGGPNGIFTSLEFWAHASTAA